MTSAIATPVPEPSPPVFAYPAPSAIVMMGAVPMDAVAVMMLAVLTTTMLMSTGATSSVLCGTNLHLTV
jgi:hypothetical protein